MIEEIKKEILESGIVIGIQDSLTLHKILDKYDYPSYKDLLYKNDSLHSELMEVKEYKSAWKELPKMFVGTICLGKLENCMKELEQKYSLVKED